MNDKRLTNGSLALNNKKVITIDAVKILEEAKLRVAAYARVSSDSTDQLISFVAQTTHYISLISSNENWTLVDVQDSDVDSGRGAGAVGDVGHQWVLVFHFDQQGVKGRNLIVQRFDDGEHPLVGLRVGVDLEALPRIPRER